MTKYPMQPIVLDESGTPRFKANPIVNYLKEHAARTGCDLNVLTTMPFSVDDWEQFAQLIGYSVSGFGDLSYADVRTVEKADAEAARLLSEKRT